MDEVEWYTAEMSLALSAPELQTLGRLLDVGDNLAAWRRQGDMASGVRAAEALDQAEGLLDELAQGGVDDLLATVRALLAELPPGE